MRILAIPVAIMLCAGCETVVVRPAKSLECAMPEGLKHCASAPATFDRVTYEDVYKLATTTRVEFAHCKNDYDGLRKSYEQCIAAQHEYNEKLKKLEKALAEKYPKATYVSSEDAGL